MTATRQGILVTIEAAPGHERELEELLADAQLTPSSNEATTTWFTFRIGHGEYGIFAATSDESSGSSVLRALIDQKLLVLAPLLDVEAEIEDIEILADKRTAGGVSYGVLRILTMEDAHREDAETFLRSGQAVVDNEPGTVSWFALRFANGDHGVFDVFADRRARRAHLTGAIPQQLALHGLPWLAGLPHLSLVDVFDHGA